MKEEEGEEDRKEVEEGEEERKEEEEEEGGNEEERGDVSIISGRECAAGWYAEAWCVAALMSDFTLGRSKNSIQFEEEPVAGVPVCACVFVGVCA